MEFIKGIGTLGFLFFFVKGLMWIVVFALAYFGFIDRERIKILKAKLYFWKKNERDR